MINRLASTKNAVKMSKGKSESYPHKRMKFEVCSFLAEKGLTYWTEVSFTNNQRADCLCEEWLLILEVIATERELKATKDYPYRILKIPVKLPVNELISALEDIGALQGGGFEYYNKKWWSK